MAYYKMPEVDFSPLGNLANVYDEARIKSARRETLADLNTSDPSDMEKKAARLFANGDVETALKLQAAAHAKRGQAHTISQDTYWRTNAGNILKGLNDPEAPAPQQPAPQQQPGGASVFDTAPPGALPAQPPGPSSQAPEPVPQPPVQFGRDESQVAPYQVAQAGGMPPGPPQQTPMQQPPWLQGGQMPAYKGGERAPAQLPPGMEQPNTNQLPPSSPIQAAQVEARKIEAILTQIGPKAPPALVQSLMSRLRSAHERTRLPPDAIMYEMEQAQNAQLGIPRKTVEDWRAENDTRKATFEEAQKAYLKYSEGGKTSRDSLRVLDRMDEIMRDPKFISGVGAGPLHKGMSLLLTGIDSAKKMGINIPDYLPEELKGLVTSAQTVQERASVAVRLQDEFIALSNRMVITTLGTLGNQISNADRAFMERAFAALSLTPEGNKALSKFLRKAAVAAGAEADDALDYRNVAKYKMNVPDMETYLRKQREGRRIWDANDAKQLEEDIRKYGGQAQPDPGTGTPQPQVPQQQGATDEVAPGVPFYYNGKRWQYDSKGNMIELKEGQL